MTVLYQAVASDTGQVYTYSGIYPGTGTATNVIVVAGMGPGAPAAPSMGWKTLLDVDFTAAASQALHTDGVTPVIGGVTWTKSGSAKDGTTRPWAIIQGTGLMTSAIMANTDGFAYNVQTAPTLWPNLLLGTLSGVSRLPVRISAIYGAVHGHTGGGPGTGAHGIALEARNASTRLIAYASEKGVGESTSTVYTSEAGVFAAASDQYAPNPTHNCKMLECPGGLLLGQVLHYTAYAATNVFPATPWLGRGVTPCPTAALAVVTTNPAVWTTDNWHPSIIASMNNDSDEYAVVTRFKVEAFF